MTCELGFEGLLSDSRGPGSTQQTESAGVMLGMRAVVLQPGGRGGVEEREETPQCPARAQVSLEVTQRM